MVAEPGLAAGAARFEIEIEASRERLEVFTYKPAAFSTGPLLVVFHGAGRNAGEHRDHARALADRFGMLVAAPRFDEERFGSDRYHRGGLWRDGRLAPREEWTWNAVAAVVAEVRRREGRPALPFYLFGHSAGGQFLTRMAGFMPTEARRIVVANPSAYLLPGRESPFPYGFGRLPDHLGNDLAIRRYLAQPLTVYVGTADARNDAFLDEDPHALRQGPSRYQRGRNVYRQAEALAQTRGWEFGWRLVEAQGVGHDARGMLHAPECADALFGPRHPSPRRPISD